MNRITNRDLEAVVDRINNVLGMPLKPYDRSSGRSVANVGNYHLSGAYGGYALHRMGNQGGGVSDVFGCGHVTKRDLYNRMHAFLKGLEGAK